METLHGCHTPEVDIISLPSASDLGSDVDLNENDVGTGGSPIVTSENANYYFRDGSLRIQAGNEVFNVHEFLFTRESAEAQAFVDTVKAALVFHEIFRLEDVLISELEAFFDVLYTRSAHMPLLTSVFEWTAVLNLASRWNFACYRELAIQQLDSITSAVDKIILGRKHNVPSWLHAAYLEVCVREEWLSTEEGERLGLYDVLAIGKTRTAMRASTFLLVSQDQRMSLITDTFHIHPEDKPPLALPSQQTQPSRPAGRSSQSSIPRHLQSAITSLGKAEDARDQAMLESTSANNLMQSAQKHFEALEALATHKTSAGELKAREFVTTVTWQANQAAEAFRKANADVKEAQRQLAYSLYGGFTRDILNEAYMQLLQLLEGGFGRYILLAVVLMLLACNIPHAEIDHTVAPITTDITFL